MRISIKVANPHHLRIRIHLLYLCGSGSDCHFNADSDPAHHSDINLRPLVYRPSRAPFLASMPSLLASVALHGSILSL
jgi:hypothetical protein